MSGRSTLVHLSQNSKYYYDFFDHELHCIDERGHDEVCSPPGFKNYERKLLELFIKSPDKPLSREDIITAIKGHKTTESPMSVDNHIVALRKAVGDTTRDFIETVSGLGYCYHGEGISDVEINHDIRSQPMRILSKGAGGSLRRSKVLHREADINRLNALLAGGERAILLNGFGGIGKTTIAHVLFSKLKSSYDRVAWISYHGTLINSFLESMDLFENISDPDERWRAMSKFLRNDTAKKIFFIDNADRDENCGQDPEKDIILQDLSEWEETTVIVTSRIESIPGFTECLVESLGSEEFPDPCVDLFYYYFNPDELKKEAHMRQEYDAVRELVSRAGFHTYAIELLARSARYEESLTSYLDQIKIVGFQFPSLQIYTSRHQQQANMAQQLRLLFNLGSRNSKERQILWDFSVLPEGLVLSKGEVQELLSYSQNDLFHLLQDSWILHRRKYGFYLHPLVREIVLFDLQDGKAPHGTAKRIIDLTIEKELIESGDLQSTIFRRLNIAEQIAKYAVFDSGENEAFFYHRLGRAEFIFGRKRLASIEYLEKALAVYNRIGEKNSCKYTARMANALYHLGYVKSATAQYRDVAKDDLKKALDLWEQIETRSRNIARAHDHLGYVLSDDPETYQLAKEHLSIAIDIYQELLKDDDSITMRRSYATACDNLGYLISKAGWNFDEAEHLLADAFKIREEVFAETGKYSTDVAWTALNLGLHIGACQNRFSEAETYYKRALLLRQDLERQHPGTYGNNVVFTQIEYAKHLQRDSSRKDDVRTLTQEAYELLKQIDSEHTGHFIQGMKDDLAMLAAYCGLDIIADD